MESCSDSEEGESKEHRVIFKEKYVLFIEHFSSNRKQSLKESDLKKIASEYEKPIGKIGVICIYEISSSEIRLDIFSRKLYGKSILPMLFEINKEYTENLPKEFTIRNYRNYPDCGY